MIAIPRTKYGLHFHDVFFSDDPLAAREQFSLAHFSQAALPLAGLEPCATKVVNLRVDEGPLFTALSSNTRYKIRRAEREGVIPVMNWAPSDFNIASFCEHYDTFAQFKNLPLSNRNKLLGLKSASSLVLAIARDSTEATLVGHAYIADRELGRLRLLYSASHFRSSQDTEERNRIGRANRLLHWHAMHSARSDGFQHYDLGGFPMTEGDPEKNAIARFKNEFGGELVMEYSGFLSRHTIIQRAIPAVRQIIGVHRS
jgi:hypothetical protein